MKNILFPTDFSEAAHHAYIYALHIADKWNAAITILHAYQKPNIYNTGMAPQLNEFYKSIDIYQFKSYKDEIPELKEIANEAGFGHIKMKHVLEEGETIETILETVKKVEADMIVMGTMGATGFKEIFFGSIGGEVLEKAPCPVLVVPFQAEFDGKIDNVVFSTSFKEVEVPILNKVLGFSEKFDAKVRCVNVDAAHTESLTHKMDDFSSNFEASAKLEFEVLEGNDILEALSTYISQHQIDILIMVSHKRNFFQELFHYSKAKLMSYHSDTPVLVLQEENL